MIARAWYVRCDGCGNPAEVATDGAQQAKEYAAQQGFVRRWANSREEWLCPWGCKQAVAVSPQPEPKVEAIPDD